ncbi:MAG: hypothetical protein MR601_07195 [Erysipelotrichaceae bacterium]|nr:hypothetical protein [Erysipelotrichaceae bacterium]
MGEFKITRTYELGSPFYIQDMDMQKEIFREIGAECCALIDRYEDKFGKSELSQYLRKEIWIKYHDMLQEDEETFLVHSFEIQFIMKTMRDLIYGKDKWDIKDYI